MRSVICVCCVTLCLLLTVGCGVQTDETALLPNGTVETVWIFSFPEKYDCFYYGVHSKPIVEYLENLTLQSDFDENPDEYIGMSLEIHITYEDGNTVTLYHFGNMFIRSEHSEWYKMECEEAARLEELLKEKQGWNVDE